MNWFDFFNFFSSAHNEKRPTDAALCGRSERPKNGADALPCLSDVYKMSTRAKRRQADVPLYGRSMVEMLGVLAIIGVLSVGAMTGYSKAMLKYKLNKQAEQIAQLISGGYQHLNAYENYSDGDGNLFNVYKVLNLIPQEMIKDNSNYYLYDALDNQLTVGWENDTTGGVFFKLTIWGHNQVVDADSCQNILKIGKEMHDILRSVQISHQKTDSGSIAGMAFYGDEICSSSCLYNLSLEKIMDACNSCAEKDACYLRMLWKTNSVR